MPAIFLCNSAPGLGGSSHGCLRLTPRPAGGKTADRRAEACEPSRLEIVFTQLAGGFVVKPGQPVTLEVQAADDCGVPLREGLAMATFDDGAKAVPLTALRDGRWSGTWVPDSAMEERPVTVRVVAVTVGPKRLQNEIAVNGRTGGGVQR